MASLHGNDSYITRTFHRPFEHDDVMKWKNFPRYWTFARWIHRSPVNSPHKGQWRGALMFSLICVWINGWVNNREAGNLRRHRAHYDVIVMMILFPAKSHLVQHLIVMIHSPGPGGKWYELCFVHSLVWGARLIEWFSDLSVNNPSTGWPVVSPHKTSVTPS